MACVARYSQVTADEEDISAQAAAAGSQAGFHGEDGVCFGTADLGASAR